MPTSGCQNPYEVHATFTADATLYKGKERKNLTRGEDLS
jgi:hypothetical protein